MLAITEFYQHPQMADGHLGKCRDCARADVRRNYAIRRDKYLAYESSPDRIASRRRRSVETLRSHRQRNPQKNRARRLLAYAVRTGKMHKEPCAVCGERKVEAHHSDYAKPFLVVWLCHAHHREIEGRIVTVFEGAA